MITISIIIFVLAFAFMPFLGAGLGTVALQPHLCPQWDFVTVTMADVSNASFASVVTAAVSEPNRAGVVLVHGFYVGQGIMQLRVYCRYRGAYSFVTSSQHSGLHGLRGAFTVGAPRSGACGKLRIHARDRHQFQYDNGDWFLHVGDTGYRYLVDTEPYWKSYVDQAVNGMRATKIRVWPAKGRHSVQALLSPDQKSLNLPYWAAIEERLLYALRSFPWLQVQVILFGEDKTLLSAAARPAGGNAAPMIASYAQARFSSFANVQWCIINDVMMAAEVNAVGTAMRARESWGSLITSHQVRGTGYAFLKSSWSSIVTLQTLDAVDGSEVARYRALQGLPVVLEEDRYEFNKPPIGSRSDWYRQFLWAALVSGGHATYGGIASWEPFSAQCSARKCTGVRGYTDMVRQGVLLHGARDFPSIGAFFRSSKGYKDMVGFVPSPNSVACGGRSSIALCSFRGEEGIVYARHATQGVTVRVPWADTVSCQCYDPVSGVFALGQVRVYADTSSPALNIFCPLSKPGFVHTDRVIVLKRK